MIDVQKVKRAIQGNERLILIAKGKKAKETLAKLALEHAVLCELRRRAKGKSHTPAVSTIDPDVEHSFRRARVDSGRRSPIGRGS